MSEFLMSAKYRNYIFFYDFSYFLLLFLLLFGYQFTLRLKLFVNYSEEIMYTAYIIFGEFGMKIRLRNHVRMAIDSDGLVVPT